MDRGSITEGLGMGRVSDAGLIAYQSFKSLIVNQSSNLHFYCNSITCLLMLFMRRGGQQAQLAHWLTLLSGFLSRPGLAHCKTRRFRPVLDTGHGSELGWPQAACGPAAHSSRTAQRVGQACMRPASSLVSSRIALKYLIVSPMLYLYTLTCFFTTQHIHYSF